MNNGIHAWLLRELQGFKLQGFKLHQVKTENNARQSIVTTINLVKTGFSKFGFFFVSLMTSDTTTPPAHSNSMLGDVTLVSSNFFMFLTPQHKTY